jgi:hypothetical protein
MAPYVLNKNAHRGAGGGSREVRHGTVLPNNTFSKKHVNNIAIKLKIANPH